ncbi:hypothetical protein B0T21DRAFT_409737 [Apiosordaria backusii]|uniref:Uncharacterized protein n=1 Tax=Apiosordaria backusii TaxID=314023 RepID=A0AA40EHQ7_9PEZI|nr:hypothetical protein B0T21DRAFT_409737 [Apiosordaria backusii]
MARMTDARGNTPGPRGGNSRGGRGGRGGSRGRGRRYVGAAYAASLAAARESSESVLADISNASSPSTSGFDLRRDPADTRPANNWFGPVSGSVLLKYFNKSLDSPESYQFQTINSSEGNPSGVAFAIINDDDQPLWKDHSIVYTNSRLHLLPGYAEKKAALIAQYQEATEQEKLIRVIEATTENVKFARYGIEDGPDMEVFDPHGFACEIIVPGEWQKKKHENPILIGFNNTPSIKYTPGPHPPLAVFKTLPDDDRVQYILWFRIVEIELFAAKSVALAKNFHKFGVDGSLESEWAALKLSKILPGDAQYRRHPKWKQTEEHQYKLGQSVEHSHTVEDKGSDEESLAGKREGDPAEQLVAGEKACVSEETGMAEVASTRVGGDACPAIVATPAEGEEEKVLVEKVSELTIDERLKAVHQQAEELLAARARGRVLEDVKEEEEEE